MSISFSPKAKVIRRTFSIAMPLLLALRKSTMRMTLSLFSASTSSAFSRRACTASSKSCGGASGSVGFKVARRAETCGSVSCSVCAISWSMPKLKCSGTYES